MARGKKPALSQQQQLNIFQDYLRENRSFYALGKKYGISDHTAKKIVHRFQSQPSGSKAKRAERPALRQGLSTQEREKALREDFLSALELTLATIKALLREYGTSLKPSQLCALFAAVAPYVLPRADGKIAEPKAVEPSRINHMFRQYDPGW